MGGACVIPLRYHALLIGTEKYIIPSQRLSGIAKDIEDLFYILKDNFDVTVLLDKSYLDVKKRIIDTCRIAEKEDVILLYISGHGGKDVHNSLFLALKDSKGNECYETTLNSTFIFQQFNLSKCQNFILIIDACYSGAFFNNVKELPKGILALTSSSEDEISQYKNRGSFLTRLIIKTYNQKSQKQRECITFLELFDATIKESDKVLYSKQTFKKWEWGANRNIYINDIKEKKQ